MTTTKPPVLTDELDPRLIGWLRARQDWPHVLLDRTAVRQVIAVPERAGADAVPVADCWSDNGGDSWRGSPDDCDFLDGLKVGDEYELQASIRSWPERFRVTKAPDQVSDDYEVEPVDIRALKVTPAAAAECEAPPLGWRCTRAAGHDGPCAAVEAPEDVEFVERGMDRLRKAGYFDDKAPAAVVAEPEWIDDPHDIEQGMIRNPKYVAPAAAVADALSATGSALKSAYVKMVGSDDGWQGERGSWFVEGYLAAQLSGNPGQVADAQPGSDL